MNEPKRSASMKFLATRYLNRPNLTLTDMYISHLQITSICRFIVLGKNKWKNIFDILF